MSRPEARAALRRLAEAAELRGLRADDRRLASLEVAVAENTALAVPLERVVTSLERAVIALLEREDREEPR